MQITAQMVKELRERTGAGMMDCKAALAETNGDFEQAVDVLRKKGLVAETVERMSNEREAGDVAHARESALELNEDQVAALATIEESLNAGQHRTILIHGVTGSGKTEVYIQAIQQVVRFGRQAILLVPEISLTPQTVARFRARFDRVITKYAARAQKGGRQHLMCSNEYGSSAVAI